MRRNWYAHHHWGARGGLWLALTLLPVAAQAAGAVSKPVLGYVFEPSGKTIRTIAGVPGAAVLDEAVPNSTKLEAAFAAPGRAFAIAEALGSDSSLVVRWDSRSSLETALPGALRGASAVAFSPADVAAIYYAAEGRIQVWRGLPGAPVLVRTLDAAAVRSLAVSEDGSVVAAAGEAGITLFDGDEGRLVASGTFAALTFIPATHDLLAAEPGLERVVRIAAGELSEFAPGAAEAIAASRDGRWVITGGAEGLQVMPAGGGQAFRVPCDGAVESATPLSGDAVFLVRVAGGAHWVLDMDGGEPRFVLAGGIE